MKLHIFLKLNRKEISSGKITNIYEKSISKNIDFPEKFLNYIGTEGKILVPKKYSYINQLPNVEFNEEFLKLSYSKTDECVCMIFKNNIYKDSENRKTLMKVDFFYLLKEIKENLKIKFSFEDNNSDKLVIDVYYKNLKLKKYIEKSRY